MVGFIFNMKPIQLYRKITIITVTLINRTAAIKFKLTICKYQSNSCKLRYFTSNDVVCHVLDSRFLPAVR